MTTHIPFYKRLFFRLLLPVMVIGITVVSLLVTYLSPPLEKQLTNQLDANLKLSSILGLQACEEAFDYLFELRLEVDDEMNQVMKNETLDKIELISDQFPNLHMIVLESNERLLATTGLDLPTRWDGPQLADLDNSQTEFYLGDRAVRAHVRIFPFWEWSIISVVYEDDYIKPVQLAYNITYWSAAGVFLAVVGTLLVVSYLYVNRPLNQLISATGRVKKGNLQKIDHTLDSEIGELSGSFNSMVESLEKEKNEVRSLIEKLRNSEAMFRSQFEFGHIGIAITRVEDGRLEVNERLCSLLGYSSEELLTVDWKELTHPADLDNEMVDFSRMMAGEIDSYQIDKRLFKKNGDQLSTHTTVSCDRGEDGTMRFIIASIIDMTARVQAEKEKEESNRILRLVLDTVPVRLFWKDLDLRYLGANQPFLSDAGLTRPDEIVGKSDFDLAFSESAERYRADDLSVIGSGEPKLYYEEPQNRKDGSKGWLMTNKVPMKDGNNNVIGILGTYQDITELKEAREAAEMTTRELQATYNTLPVIAWSLDKDGVFTMSEGKGLEALGLQPGEMVGMSAFKLYENNNPIIESLSKGYQGKANETEMHIGDIVFQLVVSPSFDDEDNVCGVRGLATNITDIKKAESELDKLQKYLSNIIDSMPSLLVAVDNSKRVTQWNITAEKFTGILQDDAIGKHLPDVCELFTNDRAKIEESITNHTVVRDTNRQVRNDTGLFYHDLTIYPLQENGVEGAVIRLDDVTEKHALQEQLNHRGKMDAIGQLAGGVAHDFNNMLSGIIGATELLGLQLPADPNVENLKKMIIESAERASGLTQKLLAFARKQHQASTAIDMHETIRDAVALLEKSLDKRISITVDEGAELSKVVGDPSQLQSILMNLGINSSHAMPEGGKLSITTSTTWIDELYSSASSFDISPGNYLKIEVRDTGCGINPEDLPHIFEPFYTTKSQGKGTGLGLSAVFGTVEQHKGAITVYSEPGKGTLFHILLPLTEEQVRPRVPHFEPITGSGTILIVDDEQIMRITARTLLENLGYNVLLAENGEEGLKLFQDRREGIDLVILDMIMPKMNGRDCFRKMKEIDPKVKVILSSGYSKAADVAEMKEEGLTGFLSKPYRIAELSREVMLALEKNGDGTSS